MSLIKLIKDLKIPLDLWSLDEGIWVNCLEEALEAIIDIALAASSDAKPVLRQLSPEILDSDIPSENTINKVFKVRNDLSKNLQKKFKDTYLQAFEAISEFACAIRLELTRAREKGFNSKTFKRKIATFRKMIALELDPETPWVHEDAPSGATSANEIKKQVIVVPEQSKRALRKKAKRARIAAQKKAKIQKASREINPKK